MINRVWSSASAADKACQKLRAAVAFAVTAALAGCASVPPLNFSPPNIAMSPVKQNAALISTTVTIAGKQDATGKIAAGSELGIAMLWKTALEDSLIRMAIFRDDAPLRLALVVKILQFELPTEGITMITHVAARYELIDRNSGAIVYSTDIKTDGRSPLGDNFMGGIRARISVANSVQGNIADFLQQLEHVDLTKPNVPQPARPLPSGAAK